MPIRDTLTQSLELTAIIEAAKRGALTRDQARRLPLLGPEAVIFFALAMSRSMAGREPMSPGAPPSATPTHQKPSTPRRRNKPGARQGHAGSRRKTPERIDARVEHRLEVCPCCHGPLQRCERTRTRIIEDIPKDIAPVVTEHTVHRDYCPHCKKHVEPVVPDALPRATLGHHVILFACWLHYGLGVTISQVRDILATHLQTEITAGGLLDAWNRVALVLFEWYEQIAHQARAAAVLHADETGWRVDGQTYWLWCFATSDACYYQIDSSRGSPALQTFFMEAFKGTLVSDFWTAYDNLFVGDRQKCLPHLLRELTKVDEHNDSPQWKAFSKQLKRLIRDGLRLRKRVDFTPERYASRIGLINRRLWALADAAYTDPHAQRLASRIGKYRDYLFTFLDTPGVPPDNNHAERMIRPAVIIRKNSLCNRSEQGAATQAVLMSIYRTLKLRGLDATRTLVEGLQHYLKTGKLPPIPGGTAADG